MRRRSAILGILGVAFFGIAYAWGMRERLDRELLSDLVHFSVYSRGYGWRKGTSVLGTRETRVVCEYHSGLRRYEAVYHDDGTATVTHQCGNTVTLKGNVLLVSNGFCRIPVSDGMLSGNSYAEDGSITGTVIDGNGELNVLRCDGTSNQVRLVNGKITVE